MVWRSKINKAITRQTEGEDCGQLCDSYVWVGSGPNLFEHTIGNNLANLNTTAFKEQTTSFEDLFYQQIGQAGSGDEIQVGAGTKVSGTASNFDEGTILPDGDDNPTDVALDGNG